MEVSEKGSLGQIPNLIGKAAGFKTGRTPEGANQPPRGDKVILSPQAQAVNDAKMKLRDIPDVRRDVVGEIKHRIESGTYLIKGDKIAFRMIRESILNQNITA